MGQVSDLPNELLRYIFLMLSPEDRKMAVLVQQRWRKVGEDPVLWKWCIVVINNGEDVNKLSVKRIIHVKKIKVNAGFKWTAGQLDEFFKGTLKLIKLKEIDGLDRMDLRGVNSELLAKALVKLEELKLHDYKSSFFQPHTTNDQREAIFNKMSKNDCIKTLFLDSLDLSTLELEPQLVAKVLSNLQFLRLDSVSFSNDQVKKLFTSLSENSRLKDLDLITVNISSIEPETFGKAMANVEDIYMERTAISADQMKAAFTEIVKSRRMKAFQTCEAKVNMSKVEPKLFAREVARLERFGFSESILSDEQVLALFTELKQNCRLQYLLLPGYNDLSSIDPDDLAKVVNNIEEVYFGNTDLSTEQLTAIFSLLLQKNTKLEMLFINAKSISQIDPELVTAARDKLKELYVYGCNEGIELIYSESDTDGESGADLNG